MLNDEEENAVRQLGDMIGYGRLMQLAEQIWDKKQPGGAHSVGTCTSFLVPCPHPPMGRDANGHCDWCCGAGRVTKRVFKAMCEEYDAASYDDLRQSGGIVDAP